MSLAVSMNSESAFPSESSRRSAPSPVWLNSTRVVFRIRPSALHATVHPDRGQPLLWACGRIALPDRPALAPDWWTHPAPLDEMGGDTEGAGLTTGVDLVLRFWNDPRRISSIPAWFGIIE